MILNVIQLEHVCFLMSVRLLNAKLQNYHYWSTDNPHWMREEQYPEKANTWAEIVFSNALK